MSQQTRIISLTNETTASRFLYAVSPSVEGIVRYLPEERLSTMMPQQTPYGGGYEQVAYAMALVNLAHEMGLEDADIAVIPLSVPDATFESGWAEDGNLGSDVPNGGRHHIRRVEETFPHLVSVPAKTIRDVYKRAESVYELSRLINAIVFRPAGAGIPGAGIPDVKSYGLGIGNEATDGGRLFFTAYDATDCGDDPDEETETFATYMVYGTRIGNVAFERIHVGEGLARAEDCRFQPHSIGWDEEDSRRALSVWKDLLGAGGK